MKFATKPIWHRPSHLSHVATIPWEIKNSNFCRYSANMEENASIMHSPLTLLFVHKFWYFWCLKMGCLYPYPLQIIFCVTVLLVIYFSDQFVASKIRHSRCHCNVCQRSTWYSATKQDFDKKFVFEGVHSKQVDIRISRETLDKAWR